MYHAGARRTFGRSGRRPCSGPVAANPWTRLRAFAVELRQIDVVCPCCRSRLSVDVRTRQVLRTLRAEEQGPGGEGRLSETRWDSAHKRVAERDGAATDRFDEALASERDKQTRLEDLFRQAREKITQESEEEDR